MKHSWFEKYIPNPFEIAVFLLLITCCLSYVVSGQSVLQLFQAFATGSLQQGLLAFAFKMALILATGQALAEAKIVQSVLKKVIFLPRSFPATVACLALITMVLALINWGLGLIGRALLAKFASERFESHPLLGAAGYSGLLVWHGGLSGSAPLKASLAKGFFQAKIPLATSTFSMMNLVANSLMLLLVPLCLFLFAKRSQAKESQLETPQKEEPNQELPKLQFFSRFMLWVLIFIAGWPLLSTFYNKGLAGLNLHTVIWIFLCSGMLLHGSITSYQRSFTQGAKNSADILLQFPIYFGIMAVAKSSGLLQIIAKQLGSFCTANQAWLSPKISAPMVTFCAAGLLNIFVPSGGGQWAVQGQIVADLSSQLSIAPGKMVMAFSYGDQLTNMLQPFWALPLLSITGLSAGQLLKYTIPLMLVGSFVFSFVLLLF